MDIIEFKTLFEVFLLRACFVTLVALMVAIVCFKAYKHIARLKAVNKRYGWPLVVLFIAYSVWATYTAFPTQEEKLAYQESQRKQNDIDKAWGDAFGLGNLDQGDVIEIEGDSYQNEEGSPTGNAETSNGMESVVEDETVTSDIDGLFISNFEIDRPSRTVAFEATWRNDIFDYAASRSLYLFTATNLLDHIWLPLGLITVPSGTNIYAFVVTSNDVAVTSRGWFLDSFDGIGFYRLAVNVDTDEDGIADSVERLWSQTNPLCADTDEDRLTDGVELSPEIGSNPLAYDTDGDGVGDGDEVSAGTNPRSLDSDGDGLSDAQEIGTITAIKEDGFIWFDVSNGTRLITSQTADGNSWLIPFSQEHVINNMCYTNAKVHVDGTVHLLCPTNVNASSSACTYGSLESSEYSDCHVTIALCGEDLYATTNDWGSQILHDTVLVDGNVFTVVEYRNVGLWDFRTENQTATFQLIIPHHKPNTLYVSYLCASNAFRTVEKIVGVQCGMIESQRPNERKYNLAWHSSEKFPEDGFTIKYSIGTGTDPTKADTDGDGLSDADEILNFGTYPFSGDVDGDGLLDSEELFIGTDSAVPDTDNDCMPDGWEEYYSLNPLADDSSLDLDNDGLVNRAEYEYGTNPAEVDTDEDGVGDRDELGWREYFSALPAFSYSNETNLISSSYGYDDDMFLVDLPFEVRFAGYRARRAKVSVNGFVWLIADLGEMPTSSDRGNQNLSTDTRSKYHGFVAAYWDDLYAYSGLNAQLSVSDAYANGQRYCVIKYQNISIRNDASNMGTFRVVIPESETNTVYVAYDSLASGFNGAGATIGAQSPNMGCNFPVAYNESGSVSNGVVIAYHFGTGSNPLMTDTDGDGLEDRVEMSIGTSPCCSDTDNDGLDDEWEHVNGLDPLSDTGNEGADGDKDGDGLCNLVEYKIGTNPVAADTDGDGVIDSAETGALDVSGTMTWVSLPADAVDVTSRFSDADGSLIDYELSTPVSVNGEKLSTVVIDVNGIVYLPRSGHEGDFSVKSGANLEFAICTNALVLAPYLDDLYLTANEPASKVSVAETSVGTEQVFVVQYENVCPYANRSRTSTTNALSFQVVVPLNGGNVHFLYKDIVGSDMNGRNADIGVQMLGGRWAHAYTYSQQDRVKGNGNPMRAFFTQGSLCNGLDLAFNIGSGSSLLLPDSDGDGMNDGAEMASGTSPITADTDGDELPDRWEILNNLNSTSATGDDGASGDPDGDGVDNSSEYELGTNPHLTDTDNDGLSDSKEAVCVSFTDPLPWLEISTLTNVTVEITNGWDEAVCWNLPAPIHVQCETVTNITIDKKGTVLLNRSGYADPELWHSVYDLENYAVDTNCFTVVPYGRSLYFCGTEEPSAIKIGTAEHAGRGYIVVEYDNMHHYEPYSSTNAISFQVAIPTGRVERIGVSYANRIGNDTDGKSASVGCQSFGAEDRVSYCRNEQGKIYDGMGLSFVVGYGSDPLVADTDGDGISDGVEVNTYGSNSKSVDTDADGLPDAQEAALGTELNSPDTDGDGLMDGWEVSNSFNPLSTPGNGESGVDTDGDGLANLQEQSAGSNPRNADSDGDGLSDSAEFLTHHTNPLVADTDGDGMTDKQETDANYDPLDPDMDRDGMPDGWENAHGLAPQDSTGDDGADGDPDNDGLSNIDEYLNGTNPNLPDSDGDGVSDGVEVANGSDPNDASDGGQAPPVDKFREIEFNINGDYAAWEMTIEGLGPDDTRTRKISMGRPNAANTTTLKMRKGNSYRLSMCWLNCDGHNDDRSPWYCWQALIDGLPRQASFDHNYSEGICVRLPQRNNIVVGDGWIAENEDGLLTSHVHASQRNSHGGSGAGNVAQGLSATLYVLDDLMVVPDYDRNGKINDDDIAIAEAGNTTFRFWINDDNDSGDLNEGKKDCPGAGKNGQDKNVNGRSDLLDFTPVLLDVSKAFPPGTPDFIKERVSWELESSVVNAVWTSLSASDAGAFHKTDCGATFGPSLSQNAHEAIVSKLAGGKKLPDGFARIMQNAGGKGVVMIEGCASGSSLKLKGYMDEATTASVEGELKINISSVEDMYRWMNLRMVCGDASGRSSCLDEPTNRPDAECDGRHFVFVHGYNVNYRSARGWSAEMFKRLWQAGSQSMFTAVDWYGNESQIWAGVPFLGGESLDYYINVRHALDSAPNFSTAVNALPGDKVVLAHSLGNMLVSEAAKSYLLNYTKYYMLNAAVPIEAYDGTSMAREMIEHGWTDISPEKWAARWYENFHDPADFRRDLKWKGRFAGIHHAVNCYSLTEEVLNNATTNGWGGVWSVQELFKGTAALHLAPGNCEGGWGYNGEHTNLAGLLTDFAKTNVFSDTELIMSPIFRKFDNATLHQTNLISIAQTELNKVMGDGIPAVSFAAGANPIQNVLDGSIELSPDGLPYWPSKRIANQRRQWHHSDICNVAFFYVNFIFNKIVKGENQ